MAFFSIIVPIYNVQSYLRECITSVLDQDFDDYEIVIVDDCTPDHSGEIADEMASADSRIKTLHLSQNVGLGLARNAGVAAATGDYVLFLDGDDTLAPGSLSAIAAKLQANSLPELLVYNYSRVWWDGKQAVSWGAELLARLSPGVFVPSDHLALFNLLPIACNKAYRRDFLERLGVSFRTGFYEDISFTYTVLLNARTAVTINRVVLLYRQRREGGSILSTTSPKHFDVFAQYELVFAEADRLGIDARTRKHLYDIMINHFVTILQHKGRLAKSDKKRFFEQAAVMAKSLYPPADESQTANLPSNIRGRLFREHDYRAFAAYSWIDVRRVPTRRRLGKIYWPVRRAVRKVRALGRLYYGFMRLLPINPKLVVFSEYWGTGFGCNPRAIFEEMQRIAPDLTAVWILDKSKQGLLPPGVKAIEPNGIKQWAAFARAKYFVNNVNFPGAYVKRPGQVHIQTMHGTPLKFCGLDVMGKAVAGTAVDPNRVTPRQNGQVVAQDAARNRQEFVDLLRRSDRWDYALSSNAYSTEMWSHAYPCSYSWLEFGYPRNDVLVRSTPADVERCRSALGVSSERTLVLYAPTFRESAGDTSLRLDLESLIDALPDDFVLLVRAHHTTSLGPAVDRLEREGRLINGSRLPSIVDCYLAADILITDYSSVMFDFAILDKPIVIYADDWDAYRESRGTYFDLLAQPPGAVAVNQAQLTTILADRQYSSEESRRLLAEFRERFCSLDDGHAAENVIRRVMLQA